MRPWPTIMKAGFPSAGPLPRRQAGESTDARRARVEAHGWADYVHRAVHGADPQIKNYVAELVAQHLAAGKPLPEPATEWLMFVLGTLIREDRVPAAFRGRPADRLATWDRRIALAKFMLEREQTHAHETVLQRLHAAAEGLHVSFAKVKGIYYSRVFRDYFADLRADSK
jgi:hypothetical protein